MVTETKNVNSYFLACLFFIPAVCSVVGVAANTGNVGLLGSVVRGGIGVGVGIGLDIAICVVGCVISHCIKNGETEVLIDNTRLSMVENLLSCGSSMFKRCYTAEESTLPNDIENARPYNINL